MDLCSTKMFGSVYTEPRPRPMQIFHWFCTYFISLSLGVVLGVNEQLKPICQSRSRRRQVDGIPTVSQNYDIFQKITNNEFKISLANNDIINLWRTGKCL